jgi:hypothetical protein
MLYDDSKGRTPRNQQTGREDAHLVLRFHTRMLCNVVVRGKRYQFGNLLGNNFIRGLEMILTFALHGI